MGHPFGPEAERHLAHQAATQELMASFLRKNKDELDRCNRAADCPSTLHFPDCEQHPSESEIHP